MTALPADLEQLARLDRDVRKSATLIDRDQARSLVGMYYDLQEHRMALNNQARSLIKTERPASVVEHFASQMEKLERQMVSVLDVYSTSSVVGEWSRSVVGIGPVLAAGLMAHIDISKAQTAGAIWRYAGLDPSVSWKKGEKRPWNADLKVLCWKIGDSFVKVSGRDDAFYGKIYRERKQYELNRDTSGGNAATAAKTLETKKFTDAAVKAVYQSGHLPAGRLDLRARRYAVKLFLAHWHEVAYKDHFKKEPPLPYALGQAGHAHKIEVPRAEPK